MIQYLKKASDYTNIAAKWVLFTYVFGVTFLAVIGVFFRVFLQSLSWNEELMRWMLIGMGYIGASVAMKERAHIGIEFFVTRMKPTLRKISLIVGYLAIILFLVVVVIYGFKAAYVARRQLGSIIRIPMTWVKLNIPIGSIFMLIHMAYFTTGLVTAKGDDKEFLLSGGHDF